MGIECRTAIVTGGSRGIGNIIAKCLLNTGYNVCIASRSEHEIESSLNELQKISNNCLGIQADVSESRQVESLVDKCFNKYGKIDLLVNNAAIQGPIGPLWENDDDEWRKTFEIDLYANFLCTKYVLRKMIKNNSGKIINLSGGGAAYARPNFSAYAAAKTAVLRLTENLQEELNLNGYDIQVFAIAPGAVRTRMTEEIIRHADAAGGKAFSEALEVGNTGGTPEDKIANLIKFICSDSSRCFSGKLIHVNENYNFYSTLKDSVINKDGGLLRREKYISGIQRFITNQFIKFVFIGGTTAVINFSIVYLCYSVFNLNHYFSVSSGYISGLVYHFSLNKYLNFKSKERHVLRQARTYLIIAGTNYLFTLVSIWFFTDVLKIEFKIAFVITVALSIVWTFPAQKYLTFGKGITPVWRHILPYADISALQCCR